MSTEFRRIHLLQAALQVKGASEVEIEMIKDGFAKLAGDKFDAWNQPLDERGVAVLRMMLGDGGAPYAEATIKSFFGHLTAHHKISAEELLQVLKARLEGLN